MSGEDVSSLLSNEIDIVDRAILFLITKGNPSPYAVWAAMNKQTQGQGLVYTNVKKRMRRLERMNILKEIEPPAAGNIRGRIEYKLTNKGIEQMTTYILTHYEEMPRIVEYMDRFGMDKIPFVDSLMNRGHTDLRSLTFFFKVIKDNPEIAAKYVPKTEDQLISLRNEIDSLLELIRAMKVPKASSKSTKKA
jgi:hypothetical protein